MQPHITCLSNAARSLGAIVVLAATLSIAPASIAAAAEPQQVVVRFRDLDLTQSKDVAELYRRINSATYRVCIALDGQRLQQKQRFHDCKLIALNNAVADVANPALIDYHSARTGAAAKVRLAARD